MMKRRIRFGVVCGTLLLVLGFLSTMAYWFCFIRDPIRYQNLERLEKGMSKAEVEELLGCPPGDYRTREVVESPAGGIYITWSSSKSTWYGDQRQIDVYWDETGRYVGWSGWGWQRVDMMFRLRRALPSLFGP